MFVAITRPLGVTVAAAALLVCGSATALAQTPAAQTQEPSRPAKPSTAGEDASRDRPREAAETNRNLTLFDRQLMTPKAALESWLSGVEMQCIGCGGTTAVLLAPTSPNAPRLLQGRWRRQTPLGMVSTGFVGVRNYALPLSTAMPLGGGFDPGAFGSARTMTFAPSSQWSLTGSVEKTLATFADGATIGIAADMLIPVSTTSISAGDPRVGALTSRTIRAGIKFRW